MIIKLKNAKKKIKNNIFLLNQKCLIIAEIGVNHNGNVKLALESIFKAKQAGADAVKFQTFTAEKLASKLTPKVKYQKANSLKFETHFEMLKRLELSKSDHIKIKNYCNKIGIIFLSTPYDVDSAKFLIKLGIDFIKTSSADIVDLPLHEAIAKKKKPVIISVGMATIDEIKNTLKIYKKNNCKNYAILHCVSNYPCSDNSLNLRAIVTLKKKFRCPVGFSDHSIGSLAATTALGLGAIIIEKHFTLSKKLKGPDHKSSLNPCEFRKFVSYIRRAEKMLGSKIKKCQIEEEEMRRVSRKSIFLVKCLKKGAKLKLNNITLKRPGTGLYAKYIKNILKKKAKKNLVGGQMIKFSDFI